jgi:ribosomal protein L20
MVRIKRGTTSNKHRRNVLKQVKGYRFNRRNKEREANVAIAHAGNYAFAHRRRKKSDFRRLFTIRINASLRKLGHTYSRFIDTMNKKNVNLDRKVLSQIAQESPETFVRIVSQVAGSSNTKKTAQSKTRIASSTKSEKDDLKKIEGVGPKIEEVLNAAGIKTFAQLAEAKDADTQEIIKGVKGNHQAGSWNEQAALARDGKWDELKKWQDELDGGVIK